MSDNILFAKRFIIDFGILFIVCTAFEFLKGLYFLAGEPHSWGSFWSATWMLGLWASITCYPAFWWGIRIKQSAVLFFTLSFLTVVFFFFFSIILSDNLSYKVGYHAVFEGGEITTFGIFYKLFNERTLMFFIAGIMTAFNIVKTTKQKNEIMKQEI